ncbi:integrase [Corynebacterium diphtheriae]|nr:integrase [Corynebacterium diphtheriae]
MSKFGSLRKLPFGKIQARYNHQGKTHKAPETFSTRRRATAWLAEEEKLIEFGEWTPPSHREQQKAKAAEQANIHPPLWESGSTSTTRH